MAVADTAGIPGGRMQGAGLIRLQEVAVVALIATMLVVIPMRPAAAQVEVASDLTVGPSLNLISFANDPSVPFSSPGDGFGAYQRGVSADIPFALADDSLSIFPTDSQGIIDETDEAPFFGVVDTVNSDTSEPVEATWVFDVAGQTNLSVSLSAAAMGDFEAEDTYTWTAAFDDGDEATIFALAADLEGMQTYILAGGAEFTLDDPLIFGDARLSNEFSTGTTGLSGGGTTLTIRLRAQSDGGSEAVAFRNLIISSADGSPVDPPPTPDVPQPTPAPSPAPTPGADEVIGVHDVQGSGPAVVDEGLFARVQAVVVGDYQRPGQLGGFFLQEEDVDADGDPTTSEGIFVFCGECVVDVAEGDIVDVRGMAEENFGMSQLDVNVDGGDVQVIGTGPLPAPAMITLPITAPDVDAFYEQHEGMLVGFSNTMVVSEYFQLARFGQVVLYPEARPFQYSQLDDSPTPDEYQAHLTDLGTRRVILDDDNNRQNAPLPEGAIYHPQPDGFAAGSQGVGFFRGGDEVSNLTGVLHWSWAGSGGTDAWRIRPTESAPVVFTPTNLRPVAAPEVGGTLQVAAFNVLNYFSTIDEGEPVCGPLGDQGCRGADSEVERERQLAKVAAAITAMDADIVGLVELENNATASLEGVVAALDGYAYIDSGTIGPDAIKVGLIYKPATVAPIGPPTILDDSVDPRVIESKNRPPLIQTFGHGASGESVTIAVNHLKSKGSDCDELGDPDLGDGQANCNLTRTSAATALAEWFASDPSSGGNQLIIGDLNAYAGETPIRTLEEAGFVDLLGAASEGSGHGYVFDGQLGTLDYAMASPTLASLLTGVASWAVNADEVNVFDYNDGVQDPAEQSFEAEPTANQLFESNAFRSSDHDPVLAGFELTPVELCLGEVVTVSLALGEVPTDGDDVISGTSGPDVIAAGAGDDIVCGYGGDDIIWGQAGDDRIHGGDGDDKLRGGDGNDFVQGSGGADDVAGGRGDDHVSGNAGDDIAVRGGTGNDVVRGGPGNDLLVAGNGGEDNIDGGDGDDYLTGGPRPDILKGSFGNDELRGNGGADTLSGGSDDDVLIGGRQADGLDGGSGDDECNGGTTGSGAPEFDVAVNCEVELNVP